MKQASPPLHFDVGAFAQRAGVLSGHDLLSNYTRLVADACAPIGDRCTEWSARGELRTDPSGAEQVWLHVSVHASLPLTCQRCLGPADIDLEVQRSFRFVETEELAQAQDDEAQEDVLVLSRAFNLLELIEDELLLAVPLIPKHEVCPVAVKLAVADPGFEVALEQKANPFAVLAGLKDRKAE